MAALFSSPDAEENDMAAAAPPPAGSSLALPFAWRGFGKRGGRVCARAGRLRVLFTILHIGHLYPPCLPAAGAGGGMPLPEQQHLNGCWFQDRADDASYSNYYGQRAARCRAPVVGRHSIFLVSTPYPSPSVPACTHALLGRRRARIQLSQALLRRLARKRTCYMAAAAAMRTNVTCLEKTSSRAVVAAPSFSPTGLVPLAAIAVQHALLQHSLYHLRFT